MQDPRIAVTEYDIFEAFPDGSVKWLACCRTLEDVNTLLAYLCQQSPNYFFAIHLLTKEIVARVRHENGSDLNRI